MFQAVHFPENALPDIVALVTLSHEALTKAADWADGTDAIEPVDHEAAVLTLRESLGCDEATANRIVRIGVVLKKQEFPPELSKAIVADLAETVRQYAPDSGDVAGSGKSKADILKAIESNRPVLMRFVSYSKAHQRQRRMRELAAGTQPVISGIRTFVQMRPLFDHEEDENPKEIECSVPSMTLQLKFREQESDRNRSATFSLSEEKLDELIQALNRARAKLNLMKQTYNDFLCEESGE